VPDTTPPPPPHPHPPLSTKPFLFCSMRDLVTSIHPVSFENGVDTPAYLAFFYSLRLTRASQICYGRSTSSRLVCQTRLQCILKRTDYSANCMHFPCPPPHCTDLPLLPGFDSDVNYGSEGCYLSKVCTRCTLTTICRAFVSLFCLIPPFFTFSRAAETCQLHVQPHILMIILIISP